MFDQTIEGFQTNLFIGTGFVLDNAPEQSTTGIEIDTVWYATEDLSLTFSGTWLDPIFDSYPPSFPGAPDRTGQVPAGIHEFSMVLSGTYNFSIGSSDGFLRAEYIYDSDVQVVENVSADVASRETSMLNASVGMTFKDSFDVMIWGRNLTEDDNLISAFPSVAQAGSISGYPNQPRTYGITLRANFN